MIRPPLSTPSAPDVAATQRDAQRAVAKSIASTPLIDLRTVKPPPAPAPDVWTPSARLVTLATGGATGGASEAATTTTAATLEAPTARAALPAAAPADAPAVITPAPAEAKAPAARDAANAEKAVAVAVALDEAAHPEAPTPTRAPHAPVRDAREFGREPRARATLARGVAGEASAVAGEVTARARRGPELDVARASPGEAPPAFARSREGAVARGSLTVAELEAQVDAHDRARALEARVTTPAGLSPEAPAVGYAPGAGLRVDGADEADEVPLRPWFAEFRETPRRLPRRWWLWLVVVVAWAAVLVAARYATAR